MKRRIRPTVTGWNLVCDLRDACRIHLHTPTDSHALHHHKQSIYIVIIYF